MRRAARRARRPRPADDAAARLPHAQGQLADGRPEGLRRSGLGLRAGPQHAARRATRGRAGADRVLRVGPRLHGQVGRGHRDPSQRRTERTPGEGSGRAPRPRRRAEHRRDVRHRPAARPAARPAEPRRSRSALAPDAAQSEPEPDQDLSFELDLSNLDRLAEPGSDATAPAVASAAPADASAMFDPFDEARSGSMQTTLANEQFEQRAVGLRRPRPRQPRRSLAPDQSLAPSEGARAARQHRGPDARPVDGRSGCLRAASGLDSGSGVDLEIDTDAAPRRGRLGRRARQGRRPAAHRHPALQHLPERGRRAVAPPHDRGRRVGDGAAPAGRRSADRARALARRQLGDGRLHRSLASGALARARARPHPGHRPRHRRGSAPVRQRRRGNPPPAAPVRRRLPAGAVARAAGAPGRARAELGAAPRGGHRGLGARRRARERIADRAGDRGRAAAVARSDRRRSAGGQRSAAHRDAAARQCADRQERRRRGRRSSTGERLPPPRQPSRIAPTRRPPKRRPDSAGARRPRRPEPRDAVRPRWRAPEPAASVFGTPRIVQHPRHLRAEAAACGAARGGRPQVARASTFGEVEDDIDAVDAVDLELFPIFEEEAQELLPKLDSQLRDWLREPATSATRRRACARCTR